MSAFSTVFKVRSTRIPPSSPSSSSKPGVSIKRHGPKGIYFHGFGHGIGSSAGRCGYQCRVLPGQGIDKAGLSAVPSSKEAMCRRLERGVLFINPNLNLSLFSLPYLLKITFGYRRILGSGYAPSPHESAVCPSPWFRRRHSPPDILLMSSVHWAGSSLLSVRA